MESRSGEIFGRSPDSVLHQDMEGHEFITLLPELVEKILSMIPFPQIFKLRALSKSWCARLSSISSQADEENRLLAVSFQNRVCEWSDNWKTYSPDFLFKNFLIAYDRVPQHSRKIRVLPVLGRGEARKLKDRLPDYQVVCLHIVGALLLIETWLPTLPGFSHLFVVNIFTGSWKELPAPPQDEPLGIVMLVSNKEMYKVIKFHADVGCTMLASIYDSKLGAWRTTRYEGRGDFQLGHFGMYLNGIIYMMIFVQRKVWGFLAFDVKDETFSPLHMPIPNIKYSPCLHGVACNGTLYIVVPGDYRSMILLEADLVSRRSKIIPCPPHALQFGLFLGTPSSSDGDCIFFEGRGRKNRKILAYNVREDEWSDFAMNHILQRAVRKFNFDISFQPVMNPFLEP